MAQTALKPKYIETFVTSLRGMLESSASIQAEKVFGERYRVEVISSQFKDMEYPERQKLVWDLADQVLKPDELLKISMILTVADDELPSE